MRQLLCLIGTFFTALIIVVQAAPSKTDGVLVRRAYSGPGGLPFPFPTRTKPVANHDWDQSLQDIVRESTEMEDSLFYEWLFGRGVTTEAALEDQLQKIRYLQRYESLLESVVDAQRLRRNAPKDSPVQALTQLALELNKNFALCVRDAMIFLDETNSSLDELVKLCKDQWTVKIGKDELSPRLDRGGEQIVKGYIQAHYNACIKKHEKTKEQCVKESTFEIDGEKWAPNTGLAFTLASPKSLQDQMFETMKTIGGALRRPNAGKATGHDGFLLGPVPLGAPGFLKPVFRRS